MSQLDERAKPLADAALTMKLLQFIENATGKKQVKRGANEVTKALNRFLFFYQLHSISCFYFIYSLFEILHFRGLAEFVVLAADAEPLEIVLQVPLICEDKVSP